MDILQSCIGWMQLICMVSTICSLLICGYYIRDDSPKTEVSAMKFEIHTDFHGLPQNLYRFAMEQSRKKYRIQVISMPAVSAAPQGTQYRNRRLYLKGTYTDEQQAHEAARRWAERVQAEIAGDWNGNQ